MNNQTIAERLTASLLLDLPPIALTFTDTPPDGIAGPSREVISSCAFWRLAEKGVFYAPADTHNNCPIGAMVMGFPLTAELQGELGKLVGSMCDCTYLSPDEGDKIPSVQASAAGILYGPLAEMPVAPTLVLLWLKPSQAMIYNEAAGTANWTRGSIKTNGRPGCAALPTALSSGSPTISWGCMGMRTFTEIEDDLLLAAIPGDRVGAFADDLDRIVTSNETMSKYYENKKAAFASTV